MDRAARCLVAHRHARYLLTLARYVLTLARYLLHIDGNVASSRLASEFHVGSTVFKQDS